MKKLTSKGIGKTELIICLCAFLVLLAVGIKALVDNHNEGSLSRLKLMGDNFAYKVGIYKDMHPRYDNLYYLDLLLDRDYELELNNPTNTSEKCSRYESYVKIENGVKHVVLKCGNYLAVGIQDKIYSLYELSNWSEIVGDVANGEIQVLYNYKKDGKIVFSNYMLENEFIDFYNENEKTNIDSILDISGDNLEVLSKELYRKKTFIKEID